VAAVSTPQYKLRWVPRNAGKLALLCSGKCGLASCAEQTSAEQLGELITDDALCSRLQNEKCVKFQNCYYA